jgi:hypothetical protein
VGEPVTCKPVDFIGALPKNHRLLPLLPLEPSRILVHRAEIVSVFNSRLAHQSEMCSLGLWETRTPGSPAVYPLIWHHWTEFLARWFLGWNFVPLHSAHVKNAIPFGILMQRAGPGFIQMRLCPSYRRVETLDAPAVSPLHKLSWPRRIEVPRSQPDPIMVFRLIWKPWSRADATSTFLCNAA